MNTKVLTVLVILLMVCLLGVLALLGYQTLNNPNSPIKISIGEKETVSVPPTVASSSAETVVQPTATPWPTYTPLPTYTLIPTLPPTYTPLPTYTFVPTVTPVMEAMFTPNQPVFCRQGPNLDIWWDAHEALKEGQTVKIVGKSSPEWGLWWYVQKESGARCWVYSELGSTSGNVAGVPEVSTPLTPTPTVLRVSIINNHPFALCQIFISYSDANDWRAILDGVILGPGEKIKFDTAVGWYDIQIYDCFNNLVDQAYNFDIKPDKTKFSTP